MTIPDWNEWCLERVEEAREYANLYGLNIQTGMLHRLYANIYDLQDRFPDLPLDVALKNLARQAAIADHEEEKTKTGTTSPGAS